MICLLCNSMHYDSQPLCNAKYIANNTGVDRNRNRISRLLKRYLKAKCTRIQSYSRALRRIKGFFQTVVKGRSGLISRGPGGDRVAVRVGVVQMGRVNDQWVRVLVYEEMTF